MMTLRALGFAVIAVVGANVALAGLKATAPKHVDLTGLWKINAELSDDPQEILDKRREKAMGRRGMRGGMGGMGGGMGRGPGGGGDTGGPPDARREHGRHGREDSDDRESMHESMERMLATQEQLDIKQDVDSVTLSSIDDTSRCKSGATVQVSTPDGNLADRQCGWKRSTYLIELKSPKGLTRTEEYKLAKSGNQLIVVTQFKGGRGSLSGLKIKRTYDRLVAR